jgi:hypothetical protein
MYLKSTLFFLIVSFSCATHALPSSFFGQWQSIDSADSGQIFIRIHEQHGDTVRGTIEITGYKDCASPISFLGTKSGKKLLVASDAKIVCGYAGKLTGEVEEGSEGYTGTFLYRFWGITWMRGNFSVASGPEHVENHQ